MIVSFATFCYSGDAPRLHAPGQLKKQVESNGYPFDEIIIIHQNCSPYDFENPSFEDYKHPNLTIYTITNLDEILTTFGIDLSKEQYKSPTDSHHSWKPHVTNHLAAISKCNSDYIVFADADCWIVRQPSSWVKKGIEILERDKSIFIVSPNDGEPERKTRRMSQQMFMVRTEEFRNANFNQPGWDGDVTKLDTMPEYAGMLEGRMEFHCRQTGQYRYVLDPSYRYWHHNRTDENGDWLIDYSKY